ncbi:MAG: glycosyltransferase involved in cell wall biosynthesis [Saprospiraceae bacterium]|jgi:glycosyltransferase involved in cell wall biosynthesis
MKIIHIVKYYDPCQGGMETVVKNIVEGIIDNSDEVSFTVYSNNHKRNFVKSVQEKNREIIIKEITPAHLKSQPLNMRYPSLKSLINDNDVIHHHYPFPTMEFTLLRYLKLMSNKKLIITWHANIKNSRWSWIEQIYNPMIEKVLERADAIIVTSPQLFESSLILQKYKDKVQTIPLSFDPKFTSLNSRKYPDKRCFELLFVGKLRKYKGVEYLIRAIEKLEVKLNIVGDGEEVQNLMSLVNELDLEKKITFFSNVSDDQLVEYYKKSDLFVLPSINEAEAFGVVQLEAMANGLPVVNTKLKSGVPFVSLDGYSGFTVEANNSESLKLAIEKIINDKSLYEFFSSNALERVKLFSRDKMSEAYLDLYKKN